MHSIWFAHYKNGCWTRCKNTNNNYSQVINTLDKRQGRVLEKEISVKINTEET
jgi:hypothetical protein